MLVHRFFGSIRVPFAHGGGDLHVALESEFLRCLIPFDLAPALHQPVHDRCMDGVEDRVVANPKENAVKLDILSINRLRLPIASRFASSACRSSAR